MRSFREFRDRDSVFWKGGVVERPFGSVEFDPRNEFRTRDLRGFRKVRVLAVPRPAERGDDLEVSARIRVQCGVRRRSARFFERGHDAGKNFARARRARNALHVRSVLISAPNGQKVVIRIPDRVVVSEISGSPRFYEHEMFRKIERGQRSEFPKFERPVGEDFFNVQSGFRFCRFPACGTFSRNDGEIAKRPRVREYRIRPKEFVERDFAHAERECETVMVAVFGEGGDAERPHEPQEFAYAHFFRHFHGRNVETSGERFGHGDGSAVRKGIVFGLVGGSFGGFECHREVENGVFGRHALVLHRQEVGERLGGRADLPGCENGVHLSAFRRTVVRPAHEHENFLGFPVDHEYRVIGDVAPRDFRKRAVRDLLNPVREIEVDRRFEKRLPFGIDGDFFGLHGIRYVRKRIFRNRERELLSYDERKFFFR